MGLAVKFGEVILPTVGGLLLFGLNDRVAKLLPQASLQLTRVGGQDANAPIVERVHLHGNLLRQYDGALHFLKRYVDLWDAKPSRKTLENHDGFLSGRANYHRAAIHEALANMLVHRAWQLHDRPTRITVYDDSLEFINPANQFELPLISLRYGIPQAPNTRLKAVFTNEHYGTTLAPGGLPMLFAQSTDFARRTPEGPAINNNEFRLKIYGLR